MKALLLGLAINLISGQINETQEFKINKNLTYLYKKPESFQWFLDIPKDFSGSYEIMTSSEYVNNWLIIGASTWLLWIFDQEILDESQRLGKQWGVGNEENTATYISVGNYPLFRGPSDIGSAMYFIGDGWTHLTVSLGFYLSGSIQNDFRALSTAGQIAEGMVSLGTLIQVLKHISGRESPFASSRPRGRWVPFPNQIEYHKFVSKYDAFPSGHVATTLMTITIVSENYPEYKWIPYLGYSALSLLTYQMMNNGVHWASDYPLGYALGYLFGKMIAKRNIHVISSDNDSEAWLQKLKIDPDYFPIENTIGLKFTYRF